MNKAFQRIRDLPGCKHALDQTIVEALENEDALWIHFPSEAESCDERINEELIRMFHNIGVLAGWPVGAVFKDESLHIPSLQLFEKSKPTGPATAHEIMYVDQRRIGMKETEREAQGMADVTNEGKLVLGRCEEVLSRADFLPPRSVDAVISDPPYVDYDGWRGHTTVRHHAEGTVAEQARLVGKVAQTLVKRAILKAKCVWMTFMPLDLVHEFVPPVLRAFEGLEYDHQTLVWDKGCGTKTGGHCTFQRVGEGILYVNIGRRFLGEKTSDGQQLLHSNILRYQRSKTDCERGFWKPLALMKHLVQLVTYDGAAGADQVVLDPFAGAGTTGVAAIECGRDYRLIESHPDQHRLAAANVAASLLGQVRQAPTQGTGE
ncbi:DNA methyltransferase [Verrucomicrobiota bacterium]